MVCICRNEAVRHDHSYLRTRTRSKSRSATPAPPPTPMVTEGKDERMCVLCAGKGDHSSTVSQAVRCARNGCCFCHVYKCTFSVEILSNCFTKAQKRIRIGGHFFVVCCCRSLVVCCHVAGWMTGSISTVPSGQLRLTKKATD